MSYYMGDFYAQGGIRGIPAGDPGFLSILGGIGKSLAGLVPGGGAIVRAGETALARVSSGGLARRIAGGVLKHPTMTMAGGASLALGAGALGERLIAGAPMGPVLGMKGFHMSRAHRRYGVYPRPPHLVRNRRMRVTNPRALRRSIRRLYGFERLARRVMRFTSPRPRRFAGFRQKRRGVRKVR